MIEGQITPIAMFPIDMKYHPPPGSGGMLTNGVPLQPATINAPLTETDNVMAISSMKTTNSCGLVCGSNDNPGVIPMTSMMGTLMVKCGFCCEPICDRYIMRIVNTSYHEGCLKCTACSMRLVHSCFIREGKLYCRLDYERHFSRNRCLGCGDKINSEELVMRTLDYVFHVKCFFCVVCGTHLKKGEQYVIKQGQLFCRHDYEKEVEMLQNIEDFYGDDLFPPKIDGRRGPKRPRTILNTQQRRAFKASFEVSPKPCRKVRENLAKETGLSIRIVQVWFQNQRAKMKKNQKKGKTESKENSETDSQESDGGLMKIKDEQQSDNESSEIPFNANEKLHSPKENFEDDGQYNLSDINKENCNRNMEPHLNAILGLNYATLQQIMSPFGQTQMLNPIDRLYSMQNAYFRGEDLGYVDSKENIEH